MDALVRELLADLLDDAARALRGGDDAADSLALHVMAFAPLADCLGKLGAMTVRQRDRERVRRVLSDLRKSPSGCRPGCRVNLKNDEGRACDGL